MRKIFGISLCLLISLFILTGCKIEKNTIVTVIEINDTSLLVEDNEKGKYYVSINEETRLLDNNGEEIQITTIKVSDKLIITHNGEIKESDPATYGEIYRIQLQKKES